MLQIELVSEMIPAALPSLKLAPAPSPPELLRFRPSEPQPDFVTHSSPLLSSVMPLPRPVLHAALVACLYGRTGITLV